MFSLNSGKRVLNRLSKTVLLQGAVLFFLLYGGRSVLSATNEMTGDRLTHVGKVNFPHGYSAGEFDRKGNYLFLAHGESGRRLEVIDVSDLKNPKTVRFINHGQARLFAPHVEGNLLVCADTLSNLVAFDVADPANPKKLPYWHPGLKLPKIFLRGKHLFLAGKTPDHAPYYHFRVYEVDPDASGFQPRQIAAADLWSRASDRLKQIIQGKGVAPGDAVGICADGDLLHVAFETALFGVDISKPESPKVVYEYDSSEIIWGVGARGKTVFLSLQLPPRQAGDKEPPSGQPGVAALDISDPAHIRRLGTRTEIASPRLMFLSGDTLYVSAREPVSQADRRFKGVDVPWQRQEHTVLQVLDVSNPAEMKLIGSWRPGFGADAVMEMKPDGNHLLVGVNMAGFYVLDVSNPAAITQSGHLFDLGGEAGKLVLEGDYAYICADRLHTMNIKDPANPKLVHTLDVPGMLTTGGWSLTVNPPVAPRRFLYLIGASFNQIAVINLETPSQPRVERIVPFRDGWHFEAYGHVYDAGDRLYWAGVRFEKDAWQCALISMLKKDDGRDLEWESATILPGVTGVGVRAGHVQLCIEDKTCYIVSLEPSETSGFITIQTFMHEAPARKRMPMAMLTTVDIADPKAPRVLGTQVLHQAKPYTPFYYQHIICRDKRLYILGEGGVPKDGPVPQAFYIYDVKDPAKPVFLSSRHDPAVSTWFQSMYDMNLLSPYPLLATKNYITGLTLIDVHDPTHPSVLWREPAERERDEDYTEWIYRKYGFSTGVFRDGYLYAARISHLDVFKLHTVPVETITPEARRQRIEKTLEHGLARKPRSEAEGCALEMMRKGIGYHLVKEDLAYAEEYRDAMEGLMAKGLPRRDPDMVSMRAKEPIRLDGRTDEWKGAPEHNFGRGKATVKSQWDNENVYFLFAVNDATYDPPVGEQGEWDGDGVEIYLNTTLAPALRNYSVTDYQYIFTPNNRRYIHNNNPRFLNTTVPVFSRVAGRQTDRGYVMEVALSAIETWFFPRPGARIAWSCHVNDRANGIGGAIYPLVEEGHECVPFCVNPYWLQVEFQ